MGFLAGAAHYWTRARMAAARAAGGRSGAQTLRPPWVTGGLGRRGLACALTEGGSGGLGVISGVTAFRYTGDNVTLYSADLGPAAQALYNRAAHA
jgi:hypothetical protein